MERKKFLHLNYGDENEPLKLKMWQISRQIVSASISHIYDNRLHFRKRPVE